MLFNTPLAGASFPKLFDRRDSFWWIMGLVVLDLWAFFPWRRLFANPHSTIGASPKQVISKDFALSISPPPHQPETHDSRNGRPVVNLSNASPAVCQNVIKARPGFAIAEAESVEKAPLPSDLGTIELPSVPEFTDEQSERQNPSVNGSESYQQIIGERFKEFCNEGKHFLSDDFAELLRPCLPGVDVAPVFRPTGAHELYFADTRETSARCYWRVTIDDQGEQDYLVPCPAGPEFFDGIRGFEIPNGGAVSPMALALCEPARLHRNGLRWEIKKPGKLA